MKKWLVLGGIVALAGLAALGALLLQGCQREAVPRPTPTPTTYQMATRTARVTAMATATATATPAPRVNSPAACVTTQKAKVLIGLDIQSLATEPCAFVWRAVDLASGRGTCPSGWICTIHITGGDVTVFKGQATADLVAATFRQVSAYPEDDAVRNACSLLAKEKAFGAGEIPSFEVVAGNFSCD